MTIIIDNFRPMNKIITFAFLLAIALNMFGQVAPGKYFIEFTDKNNNPFSIDKPDEFFSERALQRRLKQYISIDSTDLPVTPFYIENIRSLGITVINQSKWLNGITINLPDISLLDSIMKFPFVKKIHKNDLLLMDPDPPTDKYSFETASMEEIITRGDIPGKQTGTDVFNYGPSYKQIHMVNGDLLHQQNYRGEGKIIAVLDAGFLNADILPVFDSIRIDNRILETRDFVVPGNDVYRESMHGMAVLSIIGGNLPGQLIGTAPKASFLLYRTEDANSEYLIEEYNWISGAEAADSAGADIITSSLGYTTFDNPDQDHTCTDMSGNHTPITRGANIAASKGMIVVASAGNSGGTTWQCMSAPADGSCVLAVGSVDSLGNYSLFSSVGEATSRIKPNVTSMGERTVMAGSDGSIMRGSGTSCSAPIISGMMACLWQAVPSGSNFLLMRAVELSSNQVMDPDSLKGYGIPDFMKAMTLVGEDAEKTAFRVDVIPNPFLNHFTLLINSSREQPVRVEIIDQLGRSILPVISSKCRVGENRIYICNHSLSVLKSGLYFIKIMMGNDSSVHSIIKSPRN